MHVTVVVIFYVFNFIFCELEGSSIKSFSEIRLKLALHISMQELFVQENLKKHHNTFDASYTFAIGASFASE